MTIIIDIACLILPGLFILGLWLLAGLCALEKYNKEFDNPLWRPFMVILGPLSYGIMGIALIVEVIIDWVDEIKDYYEDRKKDRK